MLGTPHRRHGSGCEEVTDGCRDLRGMRFQREVPGVEEADNCSWDVALECLRAARQEERIVLAPHGEERRLAGAEVGLESRGERDVTFVVAEQGQVQFI